MRRAMSLIFWRKAMFRPASAWMHDWGGNVAGDFQGAVAAFFGSMGTASAVMRIVADNGFVSIPMRRRIAVTSLAATAYAAGGGAPKPISRLTLANDRLDPRMAAAMFVCSDELLVQAGASGAQLFANELRKAIGRVIDDAVLGEVLDFTDLPTVSPTGPLRLICLLRYGPRAMRFPLAPAANCIGWPRLARSACWPVWLTMSAGACSMTSTLTVGFSWAGRSIP